MHTVKLSTTFKFRCYGVHEAKRLGLVPAYRSRGTHDMIAGPYRDGEGELLRRFLEENPDAICVAGSDGIRVYRPKEVVV